MKHAMCLLGNIPVRKEPDDRTEMVTQFLFGELMEIFEEQGKWARIRNAHDGYQGWVDRKQIHLIADTEYHQLRQSSPHISAELLAPVHCINTSANIHIPMGSRLYIDNTGIMKVGNLEFLFEGKTNHFPFKSYPQIILENAEKLLHAPYLWGGKTINGIDCSGFVQLVFALSGIELPRDSSQQVLYPGLSLSFISEAQPGDVAFFDNADGTVIHTGILDGQGRIIHASGRVRIDHIDHQGIFNAETKTYSHQFRIAKSFIGM
ncbi:MAG: C40 family peptidase [Bacteroidales bacterium]|jgi:hypothetical protein|nr:C40 family peptidase [Bacteroidales bacterium]MDD3665711.1 C40 family peptidase [Bacteroidales bacterium]